MTSNPFSPASDLQSNLGRFLENPLYAIISIFWTGIGVWELAWAPAWYAFAAYAVAVPALIWVIPYSIPTKRTRHDSKRLLAVAAGIPLALFVVAALIISTMINLFFFIDFILSFMVSEKFRKPLAELLTLGTTWIAYVIGKSRLTGKG